MIGWSKLRTNAVLDWQLVTAKVPGSRSRLGRLVTKYWAIARDARVMRIAGKSLHYDNRFTPALIAGYLRDVETLARYVPLDSLHTFVDVGANVGQLSFALKLHRPDLRIWSFEPNPEITPLLQRNASEWPSWTVVPEGVGASARVPLHFVKGKSGQGSIHRENAVMNLDASAVVSVDIAIEPLSANRARSFGMPAEVDLLKIDVEGAEADALAHVTGIRPRFVLMEVSVGRSGAAPISDLEDIMRTSWAAAPTLVWQSNASLAHGTQECLWRIP